MLQILFILVYLSTVSRADEASVFLPQSGEATTVTEPTTLLICEGAVANLTCPPQRQIRVRLANFGRFTFKDCNPTLSIMFDQQCKNDQTVPALRQRCDDRRECLVPVNVETFSADGDDPCPGTTKYLDVIYDCVVAPTTTSSTTTTTTTTAAATPPTSTTILAEATAEISRTTGVGELVEHGDYGTHLRSESGDQNREGVVRPSGKFCQPTLVRHVQWPRIAIGHLARVVCPTASSATSAQLLSGVDGAFATAEQQRGRLLSDDGDDERVAEWMCDVDGRWSPPDAPDLRRCASSWTLKARADLDDEDASVLETVVYMEESLRDLDASLRTTDALYGGDLINIVHMLQRLALAYAQRADGLGAVRTIEITKVFIDIVGQLLTGRHRAAWTDIGGRSERARLADALVGDDGLVAHVLAPLLSTLSTGGGAKQVRAADSTVNAEVLLVPARSYDFFVVPTADSSDERATLPKAALRGMDDSEAGLTGIVFASYPPDVGHYLKPSVTSGRPSDSSAETLKNESVERSGFVVVSRVISIWIRGRTTNTMAGTVGGGGAAKEDAPITVFFRMRPDDATLSDDDGFDLRCVWWRRATMTWRQHGCHMTERNATHAVCECADPRTHGRAENSNEAEAMMRFAVVRTPKPAPLDGGSVGPNVVHLLTSILFNYGLVASCVMALLCLGLALLSLYAIGAATCCERVTIHRHLCASLCVAEALLLIGALRTTLSSAACEQWLDLAFWLFALAAFAWTLIDALYLYRYGYAVGRPFIADPTVLVQSKQHVDNVGRRVAMFYVFGYGVPLLVVSAFVSAKRIRQGRGITAAEGGPDDFCWLSGALGGGADDVAFLAPGALLLAAASLLLSLLLRDICRTSGGGTTDTPCTARNFYTGGCNATPSSRQPQVVANPFEKLYSASSTASSAASPTPPPDGVVSDDALRRDAMKSTATVVLSLAACLTFAALWAAATGGGSGGVSALWATAFCAANVVLALVILAGHVLWDKKMQFDYEKWLARRDWPPAAWLVRIYQRISSAGGGSLSDSSSASASPNGGHSTAALVGTTTSSGGGGVGSGDHNHTFYFPQQAPRHSSGGFTNATTASTATDTTGLGSATNCCGNGTSTSSDVSDCLLACNSVGALRTLIIPNDGGGSVTATEPHYNGSASCCSAASLSALRKTSLGTTAAAGDGSASCCMPRRAKVSVAGGCRQGGGSASAASAHHHAHLLQQHPYGMGGAPSTQQLLLPGQQPEVCACYALGAENGAYDYATIPYGDFGGCSAVDVSHHQSVNGAGNASLARRPSPHPSFGAVVGGRQQPLRVETPQVPPSTGHAAAEEYRGSCPPPVFPPPPPPPLLPPLLASEPCCGGCGHHQVSTATYRQSMIGVDDSSPANSARQCGTPTVCQHQPHYGGQQHFAAHKNNNNNNSCTHLQQAQQNSPSPLRGSCRLLTHRSSQAFGSQTHLLQQMQNQQQQQPYYGCQQQQQQICLRRDVLSGSSAIYGGGAVPQNLVLRMDFSRNEPLFTEEIPQQLLVDDDDAVD